MVFDHRLKSHFRHHYSMGQRPVVSGRSLGMSGAMLVADRIIDEERSNSSHLQARTRR